MQYIIQSKAYVAPGIVDLTLKGDTSSIKAPGQFVQISVPGFFLRRPISVASWDADSLRILFRFTGEGTRTIADMQPGSALDILPGLGNGFDPSVSCQRPLVVGGGIGLPPLYGLTCALLARGKAPTVLIGASSAADLILIPDFQALDVPIHITTLDGSTGVQGLVTDVISTIDHDYFFACGPYPMLRAVAEKTDADGQISLEERMACGFGACMGCSCETRAGVKRVCKDGPVFKKGDILWHS